MPGATATWCCTVRGSADVTVVALPVCVDTAMNSERTATVSTTVAIPAATLGLEGIRQCRIGFSTTAKVTAEITTATTSRPRLSARGSVVFPTRSAAMIRMGQCQR